MNSGTGFAHREPTGGQPSAPTSDHHYRYVIQRQGLTTTFRSRLVARGTASLSVVISITTKSPYALQALAELGRCGGAGPVPIGELARRRDIPSAVPRAALRRPAPCRPAALAARGEGRVRLRPRPVRHHRARGRRAAGRPVRPRRDRHLRRSRRGRPQGHGRHDHRRRRRARGARGGRGRCTTSDPAPRRALQTPGVVLAASMPRPSMQVHGRGCWSAIITGQHGKCLVRDASAGIRPTRNSRRRSGWTPMLPRRPSRPAALHRCRPVLEGYMPHWAGRRRWDCRLEEHSGARASAVFSRQHRRPPAASPRVPSWTNRWHVPGVRPGARVGTSSAQARRWAAQALLTVELEEAPSDDRNGTRPAPSADHGRVAGHRDGRDLAQADRAGRPRWRAAVRYGVPGPRAGGGAGGDDGMAVRRRGVRRDRGARPSRRAG